jgi:hypothetical protein
VVSEDLTALAAEAYIYGFPLIFDLREVSRFTRKGLGSTPAAAFNHFSHSPKLAGPGDRFVSINNDTIYSIAQVDVSGGPVLLRVPDAAGRYYVLQFVDAWTDNFAYVGRRATGTEAGSFLLVPPGWKEDAPPGTRVIGFPTTVGSIVGRWACEGPADLPDFYLVANPIGRYSIGDRTPGLRRDEDGSLTIVIQHEQPAETSNWLPAPAAPSRPIMRLYQPRAAVLDGSYQIPPMVRR